MLSTESRLLTLKRKLFHSVLPLHSFVRLVSPRLARFACQAVRSRTLIHNMNALCILSTEEREKEENKKWTAHDEGETGKLCSLKLQRWYVTLTGKRNEYVFDLHVDESVKKNDIIFHPPVRPHCYSFLLAPFLCLKWRQPRKGVSITHVSHRWVCWFFASGFRCVALFSTDFALTKRST